jgi:integrase
VRKCRPWGGEQGAWSLEQSYRDAILWEGELRAAEWSEMDLDAAEWRIAAHRTKMRRPHLVPLAHQAVGILRELEPLTGRSRYVVPSRIAVRKLSREDCRAGEHAAARRGGRVMEPSRLAIVR